MAQIGSGGGGGTALPDIGGSVPGSGSTPGKVQFGVYWWPAPGLQATGYKQFVTLNEAIADAKKVIVMKGSGQVFVLRLSDMENVWSQDYATGEAVAPGGPTSPPPTPSTPPTSTDTTPIDYMTILKVIGWLIVAGVSIYLIYYVYKHRAIIFGKAKSAVAEVKAEVKEAVKA